MSHPIRHNCGDPEPGSGRQVPTVCPLLHMPSLPTSGPFENEGRCSFDDVAVIGE